MFSDNKKGENIRYKNAHETNANLAMTNGLNIFVVKIKEEL